MACGDSVNQTIGAAYDTMPQQSMSYFDDSGGIGSSVGLGGICHKCLAFWVIVFLLLLILFSGRR